MSNGPRSKATKAIHAFLKEHGPVTHDALATRFRAEAAADGMSAGVWLTRRLDGMATAGFVQHTPVGWVANDLPDSNTRKVRAPGEPAIRRQKQDEATPVDPERLARPNRTSMFEGGTYVPPVQTHRAGSMDYASRPSLIQGEPRAYRRGW